MHSLGAEMSHKRSGLLSGLIAGLLAALVCAAGMGMVVLFQQSLPAAVITFWGGHPVLLGLSLVIAALVALAMGAVRPRSLVLLPFAALFAGGAVAAGQITGSSILYGAALRGPAPEPAPADLGDIDMTNFNTGLQDALALYRGPLAETWSAWLYVAVAAVAAFALLTLRVTRVRRAQRAQRAEEDAAEAEETKEPEYRAPFEPAQQPTPKSTAELFTPRNPVKD
ncbi:hypothetical protein B0I32_130115 [Nonomuraea fuscirosea]|uniref:Uncharacterized protein n=2 Tax=Nonomuraea fuscirosea TaxID=1291556 RepID=A0A2T0M5U1_9ACTN|nr:hypothetical protein B0I32_130115 [Nonomuraea fuscirosea]